MTEKTRKAPWLLILLLISLLFIINVVAIPAVAEPRDAAITGITISAENGAVTSYYEGDSFDPTGWIATVTYSNGDTKRLPASNFEYSPSGALKASDKTIVFRTDNGYSSGHPISVTAISSFEVSAVKKFYVGDKFDPSAITVKAKFADRTEKDVSSRVAYSLKKDAVITSDTKSISAAFGEKTITSDALSVIGGKLKWATDGDFVSVYNVGDSFNKKGVTVRIVYDDETEVIVTNKVAVSVSDPLTENDKSVTFTYAGLQCELPITVKPDRVYHHIEISRLPDKLKYVAGQSPDISGISILLYKTENDPAPTSLPEAQFASLILSPSRDAKLKVTDTQIKITYKVNEFESHEATFSITVEKKTAQELIIDTAPNKTVYNEGEIFDPTGIKILVKSNDGSADEEAVGFSWTPLKPFVLKSNAEEEIEITISYAGLTVVQKITVKPLEISSVTIKTKPTKLDYKAGDFFDVTGLVAEVVFSDTSKAEIPAEYFTFSSEGFVGNESSVEIEYRGKKFTIDITVTGGETTNPLPPESTPSNTSNGGTSATAPDATTPQNPPASDTDAPTGDPSQSPEPDNTTASNVSGAKSKGNTMLVLWVVILVVIAAALVGLIIYYKKNFM